VTREYPPLEPDLAQLLAAGKAIPRQAEVVRSRAIIRARAALATGVPLALAPSREGARRRLYLVLAAGLAFMVGAGGAALAVRTARRPAAAAYAR
jgi:hypothetical protein